MENVQYIGVPAEFLLEMLDQQEDEQTIPSEFFQITLIDEIIGDFFALYHIQDLLKDVEKFNSPIVVPYKFKDSTYEATLANYRTGYPTTRNQLTVRLSHDGFRYGRVEDKFVLAKKFNRGSGGWLVLDDHYLEKMTHLKRLHVELKCDIQFLYHHERRRIDIEFKSRDSNQIVLKLCFERGFPKNEDKKNYFLSLK